MERFRVSVRAVALLFVANSLFACSQVKEEEGPTASFPHEFVVTGGWAPNRTQWRRISAETVQLGDCGEANIEATLSQDRLRFAKLKLIWNDKKVSIPEHVIEQLVRPELSSLQLSCLVSITGDGQMNELLVELLFDELDNELIQRDRHGFPENYSYVILQFLHGKYFGWTLDLRKSDGDYDVETEVWR